MDPTRLLPLLRLLLVPGMGSAAAARLLRRHGDDPARVLAARRESLACIPGVGPALADAVAAAAPPREEAAREAARARDLGIDLVGPGDAGYPGPLLQSYDPPPVLYARGRWLPGDVLAAAVVGARRATPYGVVQAGRFARGIAAAGVTVVSGLARGVDTAAHEGALSVGGGRTVAVLGSGFSRPYPAENVPLLEAVAARGVVFSEFPLDAPPLPHHFPRRNRVLAALALGTVVVEAGERSGALITAWLALECGREVMAVPGRVDSEASRGCHRLLREGAALVETPADVLAALGLPATPAAVPPAPTRPGGGPEGGGGEEDAVRVLTALRRGEVLDADGLTRATGLPAAAVRAALVDLEIEGRVRAFPGGRYALA